MVIFIPQNIWEKQLIHLEGLNFGCHKTYCFKSIKTYAAGKASNIELLMLVLDFKVDYRLKILKSISVECTERLNEDA